MQFLPRNLQLAVLPQTVCWEVISDLVEEVTVEAVTISERGFSLNLARDLVESILDKTTNRRQVEKICFQIAEGIRENAMQRRTLRPKRKLRDKSEFTSRLRRTQYRCG